MAKKNLKKDLPKPRKLRGWATYEGDEFTFKPSEQGEPAQLNVRTCKGGKLFTTTSEKAPLQVAHLSCPANTADLYAEYVGQLERLGIKPKTEQQLPVKQRLVSEGGVEVFLDDKEGVLTYQGSINLNKQCNWQSELMRQLQLVVRTLPAEERFCKCISKIKKGGLKK
ncbi:MAG: hypothetical protein IKN48_00135 [Bacteroidaceae bacterium]|nr:hypothetical protein [Bacteroidaceae bacterium]